MCGMNNAWNMVIRTFKGNFFFTVDRRYICDLSLFRSLLICSDQSSLSSTRIPRNLTDLSANLCPHCSSLVLFRKISNRLSFGLGKICIIFVLPVCILVIDRRYLRQDLRQNLRLSPLPKPNLRLCPPKETFGWSKKIRNKCHIVRLNNGMESIETWQLGIVLKGKLKPWDILAIHLIILFQCPWWQPLVCTQVFARANW